jgi:Tfp pilus assembly protein PilX
MKLPIRSSSSGMALVITLCLIVLVTVAAVAFFTRATGNRTVEASRMNQTLAAQVTESGADYAVGRLLLEIATNSATTNNGIVIYYATNPASALPRRLLSAGVSTTDTNYVNLVRQSVPNSSADPNASSHGVATASRNGRLVGANRWNAPMLLRGGGFTTTTQLPNWIYLNKDGSVTNAVTTTTASNVIGRFAYNIYDQGGLLDVNVSGYPSSVTGTNLSILKGALAGAVLSVIPGISSTANIDTFVQWRNPNSATNPISYVANVSAAATNGFLTPRPGDRNLLSRQDLIALARSGSYGITTNALPYLTTFTRTINAPTYTPVAPTSFNPSLINQRVASAFTRADGTTSQVGEPLLKTRFPLSRLAGIGRTGVITTGNTTMLAGVASPASVATVQRDFGLVWGAGRWLYAGPSGSTATNTIAILDSASGREPNFFELLKASILSGSLGREFGNGLSSASPNQATLDLNKDRQIIQLGLNIIDQYDGDSYPTQCSFNGENLYGIENLPYLNRVYMHFYRPPSPGPSNNVNAYWIGEVWNPHRGAPPTPSTAGPSNFRFRVNGGSLPSSSAGGTAIDPNGAVVDVTVGYTNTSNIQFTNPGATNPLILRPFPAISPFATSTNDPNNYNNFAATFTGIYAGTLSNIPSPPPSVPSMTITSPGGLDFTLEYQDGAAWVAYQTWNKITPSSTLNDTNGYREVPGDNTSPGCFIQGADPRTTRFGLMGGILAPAGRNNTWTISSLPPADLTNFPATNTAGWINSATFNLGALSKNISTTTTRYNDPDSILRSGDAVNSTSLSTYPLDSTGTNSCPVILNRPFRSVAELGYAFRDLPFKSLDFFTANSADAGLLDTFCLTESTISGVSAGVINPNSANQPVLRAVLARVLKDELNASSTLGVNPDSEADRIATTMINVTATNPLLNRSELATRVAPALVATNFVNIPDAEIKARRESVLRALADVSNTRTWNVMIDVIAQAGRFPPSSAGGAGDFIVEGERRSWLHAAIDRFTGRVVARSVESINE